MGSCPSPWALRVKMSSRSPRKAAAALRASASETWGSPSSILGVRHDRWSEKGPS
ncbi:Uncharacterised protein [Flavonifractor plautii]|uniref:Uncharacterized protein n=1 Tax=Flavonifractor plautii TaxID=292800 RepID=A0A174MHN1_FLAPL|nr:Uncharacterised protein [Flavonifractor plautii]